MLICVGLECLVHWISKRYGSANPNANPSPNPNPKPEPDPTPTRYGVDHSHTCPSHGLPGDKHACEDGDGCGDGDVPARMAKSSPPSPPPSPAAAASEAAAGGGLNARAVYFHLLGDALLLVKGQG